MTIKFRLISKPSASDKIHEAWRRSLFTDKKWRGVTEYLFTLSMKRHGLSFEQKNRIRSLDKLEAGLKTACDNFGCKIQIKNGSYLVAKGGDLIEKAAVRVFREIESERGFLKFLHDTRIKSQGRAVPSFIAKHILIGFVLHERDKDGQAMMQDFLSRDYHSNHRLGFYHWCENKFTRTKRNGEKEFELKELADAVCSKKRGNGSDITDWTKHQKAYFLDAVEFSGMQRTKERIIHKRNPERRREIMAEIERLADELRSTVANI